MSLFRTSDFSLNGIYRVDAFNAMPGSVCDFCRTFSGRSRGAPAAARVIEYGGITPASWDRRAALLVDAGGRPLSYRAETTAVRNKTKRERCLCEKHFAMLVEDATRRRLAGTTFRQYPTKYDYGAIAELPPEWQAEYRERQAAREDRKRPRLVSA